MTGMNITEKDRRAIKLVSKLSDYEIFGLECFLAGLRTAKKESKQQEATKAEGKTA